MGYTEIRLKKLTDFVYEGEKEAYARAPLLAKQGSELPSNRINETLTIIPQNVGFCHQYIPECRIMQPPRGYEREVFTSSACSMCSFYALSGHTLSVVNTRYGNNMNTLSLSSYMWTIYEDQKKLISAPMEYGTDGPIESVEVVAGKPAVTFLRVLEPSHSLNELPRTSIDVFYDGQFFNEKYGVEGSRSAFSFDGKIGFIGKLKGKSYIFFDGVPVSRAFDTIRTVACCAAPSTTLRLFDNGALVFVGERDGYGVLTEIDLKATRIHNITDVSPEATVDMKNLVMLTNRFLATNEKHSECSDILQYIRQKPEYVDFQSCTKEKGQTFFRATYLVPGTHASSAEDFFRRRFGLAPLKYICCAWEPEGGKEGRLDLGKNRSLFLRMHSPETEITERTAWHEIPYFTVEVKVAQI